MTEENSSPEGFSVVSDVRPAEKMTPAGGKHDGNIMSDEANGEEMIDEPTENKVE